MFFFSWLYNIFSGIIGDAIKKSLASQFCPIITKEIDIEGNKVLSTIPTTEKIDKTALINFEMLDVPTVARY